MARGDNFLLNIIIIVLLIFLLSGIFDYVTKFNKKPSLGGNVVSDVCNNNGLCENFENEISCPSDCPVSICNYNLICEGLENLQNCPTDCVKAISPESKNIIDIIWANNKDYYINLMNSGLSNGDLSSLYNVQWGTSNLLRYAYYTKDYSLLDELAGVYLTAYPYLSDSYGYKEWICNGTYCPSDLTMNKEIALDSSQFLYGVSSTINIISDIPDKNRTAKMNELVSKYSGVILNDHLNRWIYGEGIFLNLYGCSPIGLYINQSALLNMKLNREISGTKSYCNAVFDTDMWIIGETAEILAANKKDPVLIPISDSLKTNLSIYLNLGIRLLENRTSESNLTDFYGKNVQGTNFDLGAFDDLPGEYDYSGYTGMSFPKTTDKIKASNVGWDISHANRFVPVFDSLFNNKDITQSDFPSLDVMNGLANQLAYGSFNKNFKAPLFSNYMDGTNGWYRVNYEGDGSAIGPFDLSINAFGYGLWSKYNPDVGLIMNSIWNAINSKDLDVYKFVNESYGRSWKNFTRYRFPQTNEELFSKQDSLVLLNFLSGMVAVPIESCGNGVCETGENEISCPSDCPLKCSDGTKIDSCSIEKPRYCNSNVELVFDCSICGCSGAQSYCKDSGFCSVKKNINLWLLTFGSNQSGFGLDDNAKQREAETFDIFLDGNLANLRLYNSSAPFLGYDDDFSVTDGYEYDKLLEYANLMGDNVENYFYHFNQTTQWTLQNSSKDNVVITKDIPGCSSISQCNIDSRIPIEYWVPRRWAYNFNYSGARDYLALRHKTKVNYNSGDGNVLDGLYIDNSFGEHLGEPFYQLIDRAGNRAWTIEYQGSLNNDISYYNDRTSAFSLIRKYIGEKQMLINKLDPSYFPNQYLPYVNGLLSEDYLLRTTWNGYLSSYYLPQRDLLLSNKKLHLIQCSSTSDMQDVDRMYCLAYYYLVFNNDYSFFSAGPWFNALNYDVGEPMGDYYIYNTGKDPSCNYDFTIYMRNYTKATVLLRVPGNGVYSEDNLNGCKTDGSSAVNLSLNENFETLNVDGSITQAPSQLPIINNQGYILLKQCSDGIDNDGDGLVDLNDPNCFNSQDNYEGAFGNISVISKPFNAAQIYLDGKYVGNTNRNISNVRTGVHTLVLSKTGYLNYSGNITNYNIMTYVNIILTLDVGVINVSSNPNGAMVYLGKTYFGLTNRTVNNMKSGVYNLKINKTGYFDYNASIIINFNKTTVINSKLIKNCTKTDGYGINGLLYNPFDQGITKGIMQNGVYAEKQDYCKDPSTLIEYYCNDSYVNINAQGYGYDDYIANTSVNCLLSSFGGLGCTDGKCVKSGCIVDGYCNAASGETYSNCPSDCYVGCCNTNTCRYATPMTCVYPGDVWYYSCDALTNKC